MPRKEFRRLYREKGFYIELIPEASQHFGSSTIATTIQLAQVAPHSCITAVCERGFIPSKIKSQPHLLAKRHLPPTPELYVTYSAPSPATRYWLAKYTIIPKEHLIYDAFLRDVSIEKKSYIPFRSGKKMPCYCETLPCGDRVYVVFHLEPPPNSKQLELGFG